MDLAFWPQLGNWFPPVLFSLLWNKILVSIHASTFDDRTMELTHGF